MLLTSGRLEELLAPFAFESDVCDYIEGSAAEIDSLAELVEVDPDPHLQYRCITPWLVDLHLCVRQPG